MAETSVDDALSGRRRLRRSGPSHALANGCSSVHYSSVGEHPLAVVDNTCRMDALGFPVAGTWFSARQVADGITLVTEPHVDSLIRANFYHVRGSEADLIVDTGTGIAPLAWVLGGLIDAAKQ